LVLVCIVQVDVVDVFQSVLGHDWRVNEVLFNKSKYFNTFEMAQVLEVLIVSEHQILLWIFDEIFEFLLFEFDKDFADAKIYGKND
jgi:hypothetical protein